MSDDTPPTEPNSDIAKQQANGPDPTNSAPSEIQGILSSIGGKVPLSMQAMFNSYQSGPTSNPIFDKITPEHISKAMDLAEAAELHGHQWATREQDTEKTNRFFAIAVLIIIIITVLLLINYLKDTPQILMPTLSGLIGLGAGAIGGYGYGRSKG